MKLEVKDSIKEFTKIIKEDYPNLSEERISEICKAPFIFLKKMMSLNKFIRVRLQYLGIFSVYLGRALHIKRNLEEIKQRVDPERFAELEKNIDVYIEVLKNEKNAKEKED